MVPNYSIACADASYDMDGSLRMSQHHGDEMAPHFAACGSFTAHRPAMLL